MREGATASGSLYPQFVEPLPPPLWRRVAGVVAGLLGGFAAGMLVAKLASDGFGSLRGLASVGPFAAMAAFALGLWPHILIHEAGHVVAGLAGGQRAVAFGIGRWRFERGRDGWRAWRGAAIAGIGGFAALVPDRERGAGAAAQALYLLGGPLSNLVVAALAWLVATRVAVHPLAVGAWLGVAAGGLLVGALNLVPFRTQGWRSDGMGLLDLARRTPDAALLQRAQSAMALSLVGVRPRDWPDTLLPADTALADADDAVATTIRQLRLARSMDRDDRDDARAAAQALATGACRLPKALRAHVAVSMAGYAARCSDDDRLLDAWRPLCDGGVLDFSPFLHWIDAERAVRRRDSAAAERELGLARAGLGRVQDPASAEILAEQLDRLALGLPVHGAGDAAAMRGAACAPVKDP